jgi:AcrR family transcriptional regulator
VGQVAQLAPPAGRQGSARASAKPPGRRERRKQNTREALLEAALALFGERGLYETRVEDVTDKADVGKGAFYNYFDSKAVLVAALVRAGVALLDETFLSHSPASTIAGRVAAVAHAHDRFFREQPAYALVFHQARGLLEAHQGPAQELREAFDFYIHRIASFLYPGRPPSRAMLDAAVAVVGSIAGYRSYGLAAGLPTSPATIITLLSSGVGKLSTE